MCACGRIPEGPSLRYPRIWPPKAPELRPEAWPLRRVTQSEACLGYTSAHSSFHSFNLGACALCQAQCFFPWKMRNLRCLSKARSGNSAGPRALPFLLASPPAGGCGRGPDSTAPRASFAYSRPGRACAPRRRADGVSLPQPRHPQRRPPPAPYSLSKGPGAPIPTPTPQPPDRLALEGLW